VGVAVQDRGVEQRGEQVVGCADGVDVAGEVQVEVLHRDGRRHAGDADQLAVGQPAQPVEDSKADLGLVAAVRLDLVGVQAGLLGDRLDRLELGFLRDLEAALHDGSMVVSG
jgi:hypothetical protein